MKKITVVFLAVVLALAAVAAPVDAAFADEQYSAKAVCLMDCGSGAVIFEKDADKRLEIASMTKIMTLLLTFEEIERGNLSLADKIAVSDKAQGMGGSQVYLESKSTYSAEELIKSVIISSANDSSVALAEHLAGSVTAFTDMMNERAEALGLTNTHFSNCTGLPAPAAYSSARDVAVMLRELIKHERYFDYSRVRLDEIIHGGGRTTMMTNTNKLVQRYKGCDGGKTGYTSSALHCVAATALRGNMRLISVVIGAPTSDARFSEAAKLFDFGFDNFDSVPVLERDAVIQEECEVLGGKEKTVKVAPRESYYALVKKRTLPREIVQIELNPVKAKVEKGQTVGVARVYLDQTVVAEIELVAVSEVARRGLFDGIYRR